MNFIFCSGEGLNQSHRNTCSCHPLHRCELFPSPTLCLFCLQWHALSREEQAKYYELARKERQLHMQLYPGWSARDNYVSHSLKGSFFKLTSFTFTFKPYICLHFKHPENVEILLLLRCCLRRSQFLRGKN